MHHKSNKICTRLFTQLKTVAMQQRDKLFINGKWVAPHGTGLINVIHSTTEAVMGRIPEGHARDAEDAIQAARAAFDSWSATPPSVRADYIRKIAEGLKARSEELAQLIAACGLPVREVLRNKGDVFEQLKLDDSKWTDDELLDFMIAHPILINRPIVVTPLGTRLCRQSEQVLDILPQPQQGPFTKEDGEVVIDAQGRRLAK